MTLKKAISVFVIFVIAVFQFILPNPANAACSGIVYVDTNSVSGSPDGCSWGTAFSKLRDALATANVGDEIWVADGTYYPDEGTTVPLPINNDRDSTFSLVNGVDLYGGFAGNETLLSQRSPAINVTILSGDIGTVGVETDNAYHVVQALTITSTTVLDGFTIRNGYADGSNDFGGGLYISGSDNLHLNGTIITNNFAGNGGGLAIFVSDATLTELTISNNISRQYGGGLFNQDGSPSLVDVTFDNNQTQQPASPGGGMHSTNSNATLYTVAPLLTNVTFSNNRTLQGGGGGMFNYESDAILKNVTFSGNNAFVRGGAMLNEGSNVVLNNVTSSGNTAPAGTGGSIRNINAASVPSNVTIRNSILWGDGSEEIINDAGNTATITDSVVQGVAANPTNNIINTDPVLSALTNNGGFTQTMAIGNSSSALNKGGTLSACETTDQRGVSRPQGGVCDIGAYELQNVPPTITNATSTTANGAYNTGDTINITVNFSEGISSTGLTINLNSGGVVATGALSNVTSFSGTYTVAAGENSADLTISSVIGTITTASSISTVNPSVPAGQNIADSKAIVIDTINPTITSAASTTVDGIYNAGDAINITINFSESISSAGLTINLNSGGSITTGALSGVTSFSGTYTVAPGENSVDLTVSSITGTIADVAGNNIINPSIPAGQNIADSKAIVIDTISPSVTISSGTTSPTNISPFTVNITFSESVTGFTIGDIVVGNGTASNFTGGGANYTVDITPVVDGLVTVNVAAGVAQDAAGNNNTAATQFSITYDGSAPSVVITSAETNPTNNSPFTVSVAFSENVTGFAIGDVVVGNGVASNFAGSGANYSVDINPTAGGLVTVNIAAGVAQDAAGNLNTVATQFSITYDTTAPTVSIGAPSTTLTTTGPVSFPITVSGANTINLTAGDVTLNTTGTATGTVNVTNGTTASPTVTINAITGDGMIGISIAAGVASDTAGNTSAAAGPSATFTVDNTAPTVTITSGPADPTNSTSASFAFTTAGSPTSIECDLDGGGFVACDTATSQTYAGPISSGPHAFIVRVTDAAGNSSTDTYNWTIDAVPPAVTIDQAIGQPDPTGSSPVSFTVVFSENISGFAGSDVSFAGSTVGGALVANVSGAGPTYTVDVTGMTTSGTIVVSIPAGVVTDSVGNNNNASTSTDNIVTYTDAAPTVTINQAVGQADPANSSPISFTVVFSEAVTGFTGADISFSGTVGGTVVASVSGTGPTYTVDVTGMTTSGTVIASIPAGAVTDSAGNANTASSSTDNIVTYVDAAPTVTINQAVGQADPTSSSPITFTVVFSETVTGFTGSDVDLSSSTAGGTLVASVSGAGPTYTIAVSGMTTSGTVVASIPAGVVTDSVGNPNVSSTSTDNTVSYDGSLPETTIDSTTPATSPTTSTTKDITFSSNEPATFQCKLDAGAYATCASPVNLTGLTAGLHTFYVYAVDSVGNADPTPATHVWTVDLGYPTVSGSSPTNNGTVAAGITQLTVTFSEDVKSDGSAGAANNPANYVLVEDGANNTFNTTLCSAGLVADDTQVAINSVSYNNNGGSGPFVATLSFNALSVGTYRLFVCGTTSIEDLVGNELNNGLSDAIINFNVIIRVTAGLPRTGFPVNQVTTLPAQPADKAYTSTDLWLEIPRLGVKMDIVGVPFKDGGWDVKWLDKNAGWLNGSAFPTWSGNSVLTGHVWDATNKPGPFAKLKDLKYGDQIKIHAFGQVFTYEIRESVLISSTDAASMLKHEEKSWLTLLTCEDYQELKQNYSSRRMLRAVLVSVTAEK